MPPLEFLRYTLSSTGIASIQDHILSSDVPGGLRGEEYDDSLNIVVLSHAFQEDPLAVL